MTIMKPSDNVDITLALVTNLIAEQFPQWAHLPIRSVKVSGWDNRTFRLGETMSVRLPSAAVYAPQVQKEHHWLPLLAPHLSTRISKPLAMGYPSKEYPWHWSIYQWIQGESADTIVLNSSHMIQLAYSLAQFLHELHAIDSTGGPPPGSHNFYRGASLHVYDAEVQSALITLQDFIDIAGVTSVWQKAISSEWHKDPVWIHGDFSAGNILIQDNKLAAVIDFGCMGIGDPACDLVLAWTFFSDESRTHLKSSMTLDANTWARARGWALWKALITIASLQDKTTPEALKNQQIINTLVKEHTERK
jgi:aminoglycoside phosphotransferase (APT) family kinase protein